ncbi:MAG: flagellar export chaperone FliS [Oscillospiraceae bacterium]
MYNPYTRYTEQSVMTMTNGEMLVRLYDETAKQMNAGLSHIANNDVLATNTALQKARTILNYLTQTLDFKYPISQNLSSLYEFFTRQIVLANSHMDAQPVLDVIPMIEELRDTFAQSEKIVRMQQGARQPMTMGGLAMNG